MILSRALSPEEMLAEVAVVVGLASLLRECAG
jgi:hypothetical protein